MVTRGKNPAKPTVFTPAIRERAIKNDYYTRVTGSGCLRISGAEAQWKNDDTIIYDPANRVMATPEEYATFLDPAAPHWIENEVSLLTPDLAQEYRDSCFTLANTREGGQFHEMYREEVARCEKHRKEQKEQREKTRVHLTDDFLLAILNGNYKID